jgi:hypothetical protein
MARFPQFTLILCLVVTSWLAMQMFHEFGHIVGAWWTGGVVDLIVLRPWTISQTSLSYNPDPLFVAWAGPIGGALMPFLLWAVSVLLRFSLRHILRFFAGFCLIANGLYIACGALQPAGDARVIQRSGSPQWQLIVFGAITVPIGLWLWHGEGKHFGFGGAGGNVARRDVFACAIALCTVLVLEFVIGSPQP